LEGCQKPETFQPQNNQQLAVFVKQVFLKSQETTIQVAIFGNAGAPAIPPQVLPRKTGVWSSLLIFRSEGKANG
jgi:hypothetical protein